MPFRRDRLEGIRDVVKKLRRSELAKLTRLDPAEIQHLEEGTTKDPRVSTLEILAEKLDLTMDYLMGVGPDLPFARAAVLQSLDRFRRTEGWKFDSLDDAALVRAANYEDAPHTVAGWRGFVEMSRLAWGKKPRPPKAPTNALRTSTNRGLHAVALRRRGPKKARDAS